MERNSGEGRENKIAGGTVNNCEEREELKRMIKKWRRK